MKIELHLSQRDIYFDQVSDSKNPQYNIGTYVVIKGNLNIKLFKESIRSSEHVFDVFKYKNFSNNAPIAFLQEISSNIEITELDYSGKEWCDELMKKCLKNRINIPFDIHTTRLYDFVLIKKCENEHWFYMGCHHLFSDGYGVPYVFLTYIFDKYHALRTGEEKKFQYPSYFQLIEKSTGYLGSGTYEADKNYWKERFTVSQEPVLQKSAKPGYAKTESVQLFFDTENQMRVRAFCSENEISLQDFLIGALTIYYKKAHGVKYFDFSLPVHNRNDRKERQTFGVFSKLIPCRIEAENISVGELFKLIKQKQRQDYRHKQFPVSHFNTMIQTEMDNSSKPFEITVNYRYFKLDTTETELDLRGFKNDASFSKTPIEYSWCDFTENGNENLFLEITFREDYFAKEEIELIGQRVIFVIDQFYSSVNSSINSINVIPEPEEKQLLFNFNNTVRTYPKDKTMLDLFREQVAKTPGNIAVVAKGSSLTFEELNARSNQLGHYLQKQGVKVNQLVGLCVESSLDMVIAILGILKAGAAYVPIDPAYPQERISYMVSDSKCVILLTQQPIISNTNDTKIICLSDQSAIREIARESEKPVICPADVTALMYMIFTSGSTGKPKGAAVRHGNFVNLLHWFCAYFSSDDKTLLVTSYSFDLTQKNIFAPLITGGVLVLSDYKTVNPEAAIAEISNYGITSINCTPSMFYMLMSIAEEDAYKTLKSLRKVYLGGEPISLSGLKKWKDSDNYHARIYNTYGPTECTDICLSHEIDWLTDTGFVPTGKPINNTKVYVLNNHTQLVPIGVCGELHIGGVGVGAGYLNRPDLTAEKFIPDPFSTDTTARLYKTGDIVRCTPDGIIQFVGRKDDQLKIRGYRIELGEIEYALQSHNEIKEVVVIAKENKRGEKELVAYITSDLPQNTSDLRSYLKEKLPDYMLPAYYVQLDALPLNSNGKVDRKSLPPPATIGLNNGSEYIAPATETEIQLVKIWEDVLQRENIGVHDDFFVLGGHSLKATRLVSEYHKLLNVKLSLTEVFNHTTVKSHCELLANSKKEQFIQIEKLEEDVNYPISDAQRRLWVLSQFEEGLVAYNMPGSLHLKGTYELSVLQKAFDSLIERHEILRTVFKMDTNEEVRQWVLQKEELGFEINYKDFRKIINNDEKVKEYIAEDSYNVFDLENGPLLRACLFQLEDERYIFYFNMHHIISDGWSLTILSRDVFSYYEAYRAGKVPSLKELRIQYKDYSSWQLSQLDEESFKFHRAYWLDSLSGELPLLNLPVSKTRPRMKTNSGRILSTYMDSETTAKLRRYSETHGGSLFMVLLASWNVLMYRYSSQTDIITGTPVAGREHADLEDQIGFYVNTLALRNRLNPDENFTDFYKRLKETTLKSYGHQMYPFDRLVDELHLRRDTSRSAVFDVMLVLQNNLESSTGVELKNEELNTINDHGYAAPKFDIELSVQETGEYLGMQIVYNTDVYDQEMIAGLLRHYRQLSLALVNNPEEKISTVNYLSSSETQQLLVNLNATAVSYPDNETLLDLFDVQVKKTPHAIAVAVDEKKLSYKEVDEQSNQLASYLQKNYSIEADDFIGIKQTRSEWMILSVLAVLKAGGAYVPIDPDYPHDRITYIEKDTNCKVCLDEQELKKFQTNQSTYSKKNLNTPIKSDQLAYIIYTSGSTGLPKGVQIEHRNVYSFIKWCHDEFKHTDVSTVLFTTSLNFDLSVFEIFYTLTTGKEVNVLKDGLSIPKNMGIGKKIMINTVPSVVGELLEQEMNFDAVTAINMAGEPIPPTYKLALKGKVNELRNLYGPSEDTTYSTSIRIDKDDRDLIGKPISNTCIYILSDEGCLQPMGITGELCISGSGLARGYLNQEKQTSEKFVKNPFVEGERLYKTGDLGRWLPDGNIEFLGRKDHQVKIRGYRIELGEIEQALLKKGDIDKTIVIAKPNKRGEKELLAYVIAKSGQTVNGLRAHLKTLLPDYMLPAHYIELADFPLTPNGKINKNALPEPGDTGMETGVEYIPPRNEVERKLAEIWQEVLGRKNIGIKDNFFELGGYSLKATRLASRIYKELQVRLTLKDLFTYPVLENQSALISQTGKTNYKRIPKASAQQYYDLSSSQRRLWVLSQFEEGNVAYNMPGVYVFEGNLEKDVLERSFNTIIERHEILRTLFTENEQGEVKQFIKLKEDAVFKIRYEDLRDEKNRAEKVKESVGKEIAFVFDLAHDPLVRGCLHQIEDNKWVFTFVMHHIISDGWSMGVLVKDLLSVYNAYVHKRKNPLLPLRLQYKDYALWQQDELRGEGLKSHQEYWLKQFANDLPVLELPTDKFRPFVKTYNGGSVMKRLHSRLKQGIEEISQAQGGTLFMGLLAVVNALLHRYTNQSDIIIGSPISGRVDRELENQLGLYLNTLALRTQFKGEDTFEELFDKVRRITLEAYEHQQYPFDELVRQLDVERNTSRNALFDVMVILQNTEMIYDPKEQILEGLNVHMYEEHEHRVSKLDLTFTFTERTDELCLEIEYNSDLYREESITRLSDHFELLLKSILAERNTPIQELNYLSKTEKQKLTEEFNNTLADYPKEKTLVNLFEEQAEKSQDEIAVIAGEMSLSYRELNEQSNRLAHYLQKNYSIQADDLIGIKLEKSEWMVISLLGILKSGGAYVPVDPEYPNDRIEYILSDSQCKVVIDERELEKFKEEAGKYSEKNPPSKNKATDLAHVIYTSGSTGAPAGCMLEHRGVVNRMEWMWNQYNFNSQDRILQKSTSASEDSVWEIFMPLCWGAKMIVCKKEDISSPERIMDLIDKHKITRLHFEPAMLNDFMEFLSDFDDPQTLLKSLRSIITSNETLSKERVTKWYSKVDIPLHTIYGPMEASTASADVTQYTTSKDDIRIPLGTPVWNTQLYVLDQKHNLVPIGVTGEICISGVGLARGYLRKEELTRDKFVPNPFKKGERMYKTGDLGRWLPDGNMEFIGRKDDPVKNRGNHMHMVKAKEVEYITPRNEVEKKLVEIWEEVLGRKSIGIKDNLFELGGDSLKTMQILQRMNRHFGIKISMKNFFDNPTVEETAIQLNFFVSRQLNIQNIQNLTEIDL